MSLCQDKAAQYFGANADVAQAVCQCESGGNAGAVGDNESSFGLWQVHVPAHPEYDAQRLLDPDYNAQAAVRISNGGTNWNPWSTYGSGCYRQYLTGASGGSSSPSLGAAVQAPSAAIGLLTMLGVLLAIEVLS